MDALSEINSLLNQPNTFERNLQQITVLSNKFLTHHENSEAIVNDANIADELRPLLATVGGAGIIPCDMEITIATILKVLLRKGINRLGLGKNGMLSIIKYLNRIQAQKNTPAAAEMCNVILNTCYDGANVRLLIELDGTLPLFRFLKSRDLHVLCGALGAIQGICYVPHGRQCLRQDVKALRQIASFLTHEDESIRARAVGSIHNLSVDVVSIQPIMQTHCLPALVQLLRDSSSEICRASAGTIQNLSRDIAVRELVVTSGALEFLSDLLFASDVSCQVAAVGTILNIVGSSLDSAEDRLLLNNMLTDSLVVGAIRSCIFDNDTPT